MIIKDKKAQTGDIIMILAFMFLLLIIGTAIYFGTSLFFSSNYDFRKIGYQFDSTAILTAEQKKIKFIGDLERPGETGAGIIDTIE